VAVSRTFRVLRPANLGTTIIALAAAIALLYYGRMFLVTLSVAVILAFILEPFVGLLIRIRLPRPVASFVICAFAVCGLYLAGLGLYTQAAGFADDLPKYSERIADIVEEVLARVDAMEQSAAELLVPKRFRQTPPPPAPKPVRRPKRAADIPPLAAGTPIVVPEVRIHPERPPLVDFLYANLRPLYETVLMASFVPFLVYFMLSWRDHIYRSFLQLFRDEGRMMAAKSLDGIAAMVRAFVVGNTILGVLLAIASTLIFWLFHLPYALLIGPVSGFLSLVPYIGLPLALLPPFLAMLAMYKALGAYLAVLTAVAVLHLVAMNLLYPKVVGPRVHLNPLVVTVALMFWSVLWGTAGLVLAIPLTAGIKAVCDNVDRLGPVGKFLGD
jgi:predicted PurR-regulated permease PerM